MRLKDEQGNEWEFDVQVGNFERKYGILSKLEPNSMPELEEGDWYRYDDTWPLPWWGGSIDNENKKGGRIVEIRKSNGTVWRRDGKK